MFSANGYQLMSDEQDVSPYLHFPGIFYCSCNCMCWVAWRRSPVPPHVCHYSMLSVVFVLAVNSALTKELRTLVAFLTRRFVCMCAGGKISRLAGMHLGTFLCVIACVDWLGDAQRCVCSCCEFRSVYTIEF